VLARNAASALKTQRIRAALKNVSVNASAFSSLMTGTYRNLLKLQYNYLRGV
tara:strand:- start:638 stop:793 length:156 start_codon:yes stop_codon:yes gene_type:complete